MATTDQSYERHTHRPRLSGVAGLFAFLALAFVIAEIVRRPGAMAYAVLCLVGAVITLVIISRVYIVRLQDRIIRLEMRVRLARLGREADYARLTTPQLVALRFASDAELPSLLQRTLSEDLSRKQIKEAIREWQPDYHRT